MRTRSLIRRVAAAARALVGVACLLGAPERAWAENALTIHLCLPPEGERSFPAMRTLAHALGRFAHGGHIQAGVRAAIERNDDDDCRAHAGAGCYGAPGHVWCNANALGRALLAIALSSSSASVNAFASDPPRLAYAPSFANEVAFRIADAYLAPTQAETEARLMAVMAEEGVDVEHMLRAVTIAWLILNFDANVQARLESLPREASLAYPLYEAALNYLLAYVFGHELAHATGGCTLSAPSPVEASGRFAALARAQADGTLACENPPLLDELRADRCGLRAVASIDAGMVDFKRAREAGDLYVALLGPSRRLAIDALVNLMTLGLGRSFQEATHLQPPGADGLKTRYYVHEVRSGYLDVSLRIALFAEVLMALDPGPSEHVRICGPSAQKFVNLLSVSRALCSEDAPAATPVRRAIDQSGFEALFGGLVGPGVAEGWRTSNWDSRTSFSCGP